MSIVESWHGTISGYKRRGCRCTDCKAAYSTWQREFRAANRERVAAYKRKHYAKNREQILEKRRAYRIENPDKIRAWHAINRDRVAGVVRQRKYGLSPDAFAELTLSQSDRCAICAQEFGDNPPHVDHDHACCPGQKSCGACIRGLLCKGCNTGIGLLGDDPERLRSAIAYLTRFSRSENPRHNAERYRGGDAK